MTARTFIHAGFEAIAAPLVDEAISLAESLKSTAVPEDCHKLRVALRKLRSLWWAYRPLLDCEEALRQSDRFKSLAHVAGRTRDWDVAFDLVSRRANADHPEFKPLVRAVAKKRSAALASSRRELMDANVAGVLREALDRARKCFEKNQDRAPEVDRFSRKRLAAAKKQLRKRMKRALEAKVSHYQALHEVRKAAKKLRYLLDFFEPMLKRADTRIAKKLKKLQKDLGELNDRVACEALISQNMPGDGPENISGPALDWLAKEKTHRVKAARKSLREWA